MAKRAASTPPKERPYHCRLCNKALAEDELGYVCRHVAHGMMVTLVPDASSDAARIPDTACTACVLAMEQGKKDAAERADVHVVCAGCYRDCRKRNIDDFTAADRAQGYVLARRTQYERLSPPEKPLEIGGVYEGRVFKLGFSPIPSQDPISLERMWVRVTCVLKGGVIHGALANDPELFKRKTLKADDTVVFSTKHVLDVIPETKKSAKAAAKSAEEAKRAAAEQARAAKAKAAKKAAKSGKLGKRGEKTSGKKAPKKKAKTAPKKKAKRSG
ncbi:MAG: hypothetical protein JWO86_576 [Myxococcaceae bacterium]|nr:hypothetical protein [Myxococcaceae bacterium]MEA2747935.1 hypothetical protein [Myxococcales bacterium]